MGLYTIVRSNRLNSFPHEISDKAVVENMFAKLTPIKKILLEAMLITHTAIPTKFFNQELKGLTSDTIIVFDGHSRPEFLKWLIKVNPGKRFIFWCWNTVDEIQHNLSIDKIPNEYEIWSYSEYDCEKYGFKYNTTFFWNDYAELSSDEVENDIYFIGKDKGRYETIIKLERVLTNLGIKCKFQVVPTHPWEWRRGLVKSIPYEDVIDNIKKSRAILDVMVSDKAGPTLRSIEAAFYKKKIVSDDMNIKTMKFYNPQNAFIIGGVQPL